MVKHERSPTDGYWATGSQSRLQRWTAQRRLSLASSQPTPKRARHSLPTTQQSSVRRPRHSQPDPYSHSLARARPYPRDLVPSVIRRPSPEPEPEPEQLPEVNPGPRSSERYAGERIDIFNLAGYHIASIPLKVLEHHPGGARWEHVLELLERITASKAAKQDPLRPRSAGGTCPPFMNADGGEYVFAGEENGRRTTVWPLAPHPLYFDEGDDLIEAEVKARDRDTCAISGLRSNICRAVRIAPADAATGANVHTTHVTSWLTLSPDLGALFSQGDIALEPLSRDIFLNTASARVHGLAPPLKPGIQDYARLHGREVKWDKGDVDNPNFDLLAWHYTQALRGRLAVHFAPLESEPETPSEGYDWDEDDRDDGHDEDGDDGGDGLRQQTLQEAIVAMGTRRRSEIDSDDCQEDEEYEEWYGIDPDYSSDWTPWAGVAQPEHSTEDETDAEVDEGEEGDEDYVPTVSPSPPPRRTMGRRYRM